MASPICTVNGTPFPITGTTGIVVAASSTITVALVSTIGVLGWSISATSADDFTGESGLVTINNSKISLGALGPVTFDMPAMYDGYRGVGVQFTSVVNGNISTTFGVWVANSDGQVLFFGNESNERNATVGNAAQLNDMMVRIARLGG